MFEIVKMRKNLQKTIAIKSLKGYTVYIKNSLNSRILQATDSMHLNLTLIDTCSKYSDCFNCSMDNCQWDGSRCIQSDVK